MVLAAFLMVSGTVLAQPEFDNHPSNKDIQAMLDANNKAGGDAGKLALAWYHWAYHMEVQTGRSDLAFKYLGFSADRFLEANDSAGYQRVRVDLADRMVKAGKYPSPIRMYEEALEFARRKGNDYLETYVLARLNRVYLTKGDTLTASGFKKLFIEKNAVLRDTVLEIMGLEDEINKCRKRNDFLCARRISFRALQLANWKKHEGMIQWAQFSIAENCRLDRDYPTALQYYHIIEQSKTTEPLRRDVYLGLSKTYAAMDSLYNAYHYSIRYAQLGDTLQERGSIASSQEMMMQYDSTEQGQLIRTLRKKNSEALSTTQLQRLGLGTLGVAFCAVLLAMFFIVRDYRHRLRTDRVIASQNTALNLQHIRELEDKLKIDTMQSMLVGQESERRRIAQDLHDSVGGLLAATKIQVEKLSGKSGALEQNPDLLKIKALLDNTVAETRHIARNMQPNTLLQFGLATALRDLTSHFRADGLPKITFQQFGDFSNLDHNLALNCYRIVQELLQNSIKHANAEEILVQITCSDNQLDLLVEDDGIGYDAATIKKGMGTDNIAHRVQFLKGEINLQSAAGQGASTLVTIPLP